jgi:predicted nucleic acid-binding protein
MDEKVKTRVLDACALTAYLSGDPESSRVTRLFEKAYESSQPILMSSVNWCEVLVGYVKAYGPTAVQQMDKKVESLPLKFIEVDRWTASQAAQLKAHHGLSLGDAIAAATAITHKATLVTFDDDFKVLEGTVEIDWL